MPVNSKAMGRRIKAARKKASMTQARLAEEIGMSEVHISNMESGTGNPSLATLVDIANVLSVSTDELLCDSVICCGSPDDGALSACRALGAALA